MNASVQIKTHSSTSAKNKNTHILRNSEAYENPRIIILQNRQNRFSKSTKEKPEETVFKNEAERKSELKKVNSAISVYTKRIEAITPPEDEEKRKRIQKLEEKRRELLKKREELKQQKQVEETRGRKQKHHYVEFIFSITNSNEHLADEEFVKVFTELQNKFLRALKGLQLETNAVHLDQFSVHSHALFKLPENTTWANYFSKQFRGANDGRDFYKQVAKTWHNTVEKELKAKFGIELENQTSGKRYKPLKTFKKENPVQILEKVGKINSERDMSDLSDISPQFRKLLESAKANHELANSLFEKERTSEAQERSVMNDSNDSEQTESQSSGKRKRR